MSPNRSSGIKKINMETGSHLTLKPERICPSPSVLSSGKKTPFLQWSLMFHILSCTTCLFSIFTLLLAGMYLLKLS